MIDTRESETGRKGIICITSIAKHCDFAMSGDRTRSQRFHIEKLSNLQIYKALQKVTKSNQLNQTDLIY